MSSAAIRSSCQGPATSTLTADARSGQAVVDAIRDYERATGRHLVG